MTLLLSWSSRRACCGGSVTHASPTSGRDVSRSATADARGADRPGRDDRAQRALLHHRGLVPPPIRRGRSGYYSADHVARLELVQELQSHGFTLAAIEKYVAGIPARRDARGHRAAPHDARALAGRAARRADAGRARQAGRPHAGRRRPGDADRARHRRPRPSAAATRGHRAPVGRARAARPRLPARGRAGGRRGVRRARPPIAEELYGCSGRRSGRRTRSPESRPDEAARGRGAAQAAVDGVPGDGLRGGDGRHQARGDRPRAADD